MDTRKRKAINHLAESVLEVLEIEEFPVPIREIPIRLGGTLNQPVQIDENVDAMIEKSGEDSFRINIATQSNPQRQNFSIAHELGHLFIHMGYMIDDELWNAVGEYRDSVYYRRGYNTEEFEAHEFAAALLMPEKKFREVCNEHFHNGFYDIESIAEHFDVSVQAARTRGKWLGIFSWE